MEFSIKKEKQENRLGLLFTKLNVMNKVIRLQIIIFSLWISALVLFIYYITYQQLVLELIYSERLPAKLTILLYFAFIFLISGIGLLFSPNDPKIIEKEIIIRTIEDLVQETDDYLIEQKFDIVIKKIEEHLEEMTYFHIETNREILLEQLRKAQVNRKFSEDIEKINLLIEEKSEKIFSQFNELELFFNDNQQLLILNLMKKYESMIIKLDQLKDDTDVDFGV